MASFFSDKGELCSTRGEHSPDDRYTPLEVGKPLVAEILLMNFGDVRDWRGKSEMMVSTWHRFSLSGPPGPQIINLMRKGIDPFDELEDLGAAEFGHKLIAYRDTYDGKPLAMSFEYLEIDHIPPKKIEAIGEALRALEEFPLFAQQLPYLSLADNVAGVALKLWNVINRNDLVLREHLDLAFKSPDQKSLTSGRYVIVPQLSNPAAEENFMKEFRLGVAGDYADNRLIDSHGRLAHQAGMKLPYIVIRVNCESRPEYKDFEVDSAVQAELCKLRAEGVSLTERIADIVGDLVALNKEYESIRAVLEEEKKKAAEADAAERAAIESDIERLLAKLAPDQKAWIMEILRAL